ncbi:hypothetical protein F2Q69_00023989 [Brassica cretica]|uniref:Ubiquitin-like protease family profile domain-containing protein n=1 Tax=Brassica cretica TaxID=69181 RepID=A0A8S9QEW6_BRACR|nr:hypothetical protein F2Q69_00023989 [Brassica cretica]
MAPLLWNDEQLDQTKEDSPDAALVFFREEEWEKIRTWSTSSTCLRIGPATLDFEIANRLMDKSEWVDSLEIDAAMYVFREGTSLKRWRPHRVAFMTVVFSNMIKKEYGLLEAQGRKKYTLHNLLLHGNHWIALCISFVTRSIDVFDCSGRKRHKELDGFANLIPRIVKAVQPTRHQKDFAISAYTVSYVPVGKLNKSAWVRVLFSKTRAFLDVQIAQQIQGRTLPVIPVGGRQIASRNFVITDVKLSSVAM